MAISNKTEKMLWGRAAGRCSMPDCRIELFRDETETDDPTHVGDSCHIVAESDGGPRGDAAMPVEQRNAYNNLILLCRNHHKVIDAQEGEYTVERLGRMKDEHEAWVKEKLGFDADKQFDDEQYAGMLDVWERLAHVEKWLAWSSHVFGGDRPSMSAEVFRDLAELRTWLQTRVWPGRYRELEAAFENFRRVLRDFYETFNKHAEAVGENGELLLTRAFYQIDEWDEKRLRRLEKEYEFHVDLVEDLMVELTRAANLIADRVRQHVTRSYGLVKGRLAVMYGPLEDFTFRQVIVQYREEERKREHPYPGLDTFLTERANRDFYFGAETEPTLS